MSEKPHIGVKILIHFLSFLAGFVNGIFFITAGTAVSHHTGNLTRFVLGLSKGAIAEVITMLALLLSFSTGSCVSGIIFRNQTCSLRRYSILLVLFAAAFLGIAIVRPPLLLTLALTCAVLGAQNGMFIPHGGVLIRTSHFTGYLTDVGRSFGMLLCGQKRQTERCLLYLSGIICFVAGVGTASFLPSAAFYYITALLYFLAAGFCFIFYLYFSHLW